MTATSAEEVASEGVAADSIPDPKQEQEDSAEQLARQAEAAQQQEKIRKLAEALQVPPPWPDYGEAEEYDPEGLFDDPAALERYLRARQWDVYKAEVMIRNTAVWRKQFQFASLRDGSFREDIAKQNASGKLYVRGFDRKQRPAIVMKPALETHEDDQAMVRHLVYNMERAIACCKDGGKMVMIVDFVDTGLTNMVSLGMAQEIVTILQDHYPERLGQSFVINAPWIMSTFFDAITPFLDPVTIEKFKFVTEEGEERSKRMAEYFELSSLEEAFGGTLVAPFESKTYLQASAAGEFGLEFNEQAELAAKGGDASS